MPVKIWIQDFILGVQKEEKLILLEKETQFVFYIL